MRRRTSCHISVWTSELLDFDKLKSAHIACRATQLFDVYFKSLHPHLPLLDREHSSPSAVARRANYLFNASEWFQTLPIAADNIVSSP